jgi:hypothetical protein
MRRPIGVALAAMAVVAAAASLAAPTGDLPAGWSRAGDRPDDYEMMLDPGAGRTGQASATVKGKGPIPAGVGTLMQSIQAGDYRGKRVRLYPASPTPGQSWLSRWSAASTRNR